VYSYFPLIYVPLINISSVSPNWKKFQIQENPVSSSTAQLQKGTLLDTVKAFRRKQETFFFLPSPPARRNDRRKIASTQNKLGIRRFFFFVKYGCLFLARREEKRFHAFYRKAFTVPA
jgi:hypothetical protein